MKKLFLLPLILLLATFARADQSQSQTISNSGDSVTIQNNISATTASFSYGFNGQPATVSVILSGCTSANACTVLDTYTVPSSSKRTPTLNTAYAFFTVQASWTGGSNVSILIASYLAQPPPSSGGLGPVTLTGTPSSGQVPTATSGTAATWQTPAGSGNVTGSGLTANDVITGNGSSAIKDSGTLLSSLAPLASPTFTGTPAAPTATAGTNTTQLATTAFVLGQSFVTAATVPVTSVFTRTGAVTATSGDYSVAQITGAAPLASPTFTGTVGGITASMVGLGSVTNDAQTKSSIVPNTAPSAGNLLFGNAGGTAYAPLAVSGDCTAASTGAFTCLKANGVTLASSATTDTTNATNITTGTLPHAQLPALLSGDIPANASNTSGNAATSTALATTPTQCTGSNFSTGIAANGNANCSAPAGGVASVFGRTGTVVAVANDYSFAQISGSLGHAQLPALVSGDIPNNAANTTGSAASLSAVLSCIEHPAMTGDVTSSAGSCADVIGTGAVTDDKASLSNKPAVALVSDVNLTLSGVQTIDGTLGIANSSLVLATAQTTASQNGPWVMQTGAWTRPAWYPSGGTTQAIQFATTRVRLGTNYQGSTWRLTTAAPITIDTTATTWGQLPLALNANSVTGQLPHAQLPALLSGDIPANAANTSGTAANLSGTPALSNGTTATTQTASDSSTDIATDAFVKNQAYAPLASPTFTGTPLAPTTTYPDNSTRIASTAYVATALTSQTAHNTSLPLACLAASGSGTAYTCSTSPSFTPVDGDVILFEADLATTGAMTLNVNGTSAAPVKKQGGLTALVANDFLAGQDNLMIFDGVNWQMQGQTGNAGTGAVSSVFGRTGAVVAATNDYTPTQVGLGNVTNNAQTQASIVPNTAPAAGALLVGNAGATAYASSALSGDCTLASTAAITCLKSNGNTISTTYAPLASPTFTGTVTSPTTSITGQLSSSFNAAASTPIANFTGTIFTGGTGTTTFPYVYINPGSNVAPTTWSTNGTALGFNLPSGWTGPVLDARVNGGTVVARIDSAGGYTAGQSASIQFSSRSKFTSPSDGVMTVSNNGATAFTRLQFGGTTSSFTALCTSTTVVSVCLGDGTTPGILGNGTTTVASLPAAAAGNKGQQISVSDSTTVSAEGQTCVGGGAITALAFSNGTTWKCF